MVYNAMKLFMEVNPQLFDECSHEYTEQQNNADAVKANRQAKWDRLSQLAEQMKANGTAPAVRPPATSNASYGSRGSKVTSPVRQDDSDPLSRESQQRMERLRLQDDRERHSNAVR
jgi:serine/threonine-protein phosphatase 2A regulatory subunit B'